MLELETSASDTETDGIVGRMFNMIEHPLQQIITIISCADYSFGLRSMQRLPRILH